MEYSYQFEEWRDIISYEGLYQVSNLGRVKSLNYNHTGKERILKPGKDKDGYLRVTLCKDGKHKSFRVHRLVAEAFLPNPDNLPFINHKNEIKDDNRVENLEFCDAKYNTNYGTCQKRKAEKNTNHPNMSKPVAQYTLDGTLVGIYPSTNEAGRQGFDQRHISHCCNGKYFDKRSNKYYNSITHKGFIWKWAE